MFSPINLKFKKVHKKTYKNQEYSCKNSGFLYGSVGIVSKSKGFVSFSEISSAQKVLSKVIKGTGLSIPRVRPQLPRTQKKKGMRMGKGKGDVTNWISNVKAGSMLFEIFGEYDEKILKVALKNSSLRLSVKSKMVFF